MATTSKPTSGLVLIHIYSASFGGSALMDRRPPTGSLRFCGSTGGLRHPGYALKTLPGSKTGLNLTLKGSFDGSRAVAKPTPGEVPPSQPTLKAVAEETYLEAARKF